MVTNEDSLWTIEELGARAAEALSGSGYAGVASGRVRDVPDPRTIRYYATLGLLDRPAGSRGRVALYGPRHLRQLTAVKRLQARGLTLAEVQRAVAGASDADLARLSGEGNWESPGAAPSPAKAPRPARSAGFWREAPGPAAPVEALQAARVGPDVTLLLNTVRPIEKGDLELIRMAAAPLVELLRLRGLIGPRDAGESVPPRRAPDRAATTTDNPLRRRDDDGDDPA